MTPMCGKELLVWVPWIGDSENKIRNRHWSKNHKHNLAAHLAWITACKSSPAATAFVMETTAAAGETKPLETQSAIGSGLMTGAAACSLNTHSSTPAEKKAR